VVAWGGNFFGQSGVPTPPVGVLYVQVAAGGGFIVIRRSDGEVIQWGEIQQIVPPLPPGVGFVEIDAGEDHALARLSNGHAVAWGSNAFGQSFVPPPPPGIDYVEVAAGGWHTVVRQSDGQVQVWGYNAFGQSIVPALPAGVTYVEIAAGWGHTVARRSDGQVIAWGRNLEGQCDVPALPPGLAWVEVAGGAYHTVARLSDGQVVAWGLNDEGQCDVPALPPGLSYVAIAGAGKHTLARRSDGAVVGWGLAVPAAMPAPPSGASWEGIHGSYYQDIARYGPSCPEATVYCTAKTNSLGCTPAISVVGIPSASFGNGCTLSVANVPGGRIGLYLHSAAGAAALPFQGGWLCVQSPLLRHPAVSSQGSAGTCSGVLSEDLNAYIATGSDPALVAGATLWIQAWYRDPPDTFGIGLSDALSAVICP
ncbi:MAG TPA: hypothetical protein VMT18_14995, partial [Planctomycetota bacterium]|nr:hypothetical protein [Planctomycetota bacterium]